MNISKKFILPALLIISLHVNGQELKFGARTGFNFATLVGEDAYNARISPGIHLGPYMKVKISDLLSFQPELLFSLKGYSARTDMYGDYKERLSLYYCDLPLMLGITPTESFNVLLGLQPSFLLGGRYKIKYDNDEVFITNNVTTFKGIDLGILVGAEFEMETGFNFGLRFNYGIPSAYDNSRILAHHANLQLTVGYTFRK